jgi:hypothetical protein
MNRKKSSLLLVSLCLTGCLMSHGRTELSRQTNVFGAELFSSVDYREIVGITGAEEPCLQGYERSFDSLEIVIGYGQDRKIRKITTRNANTSLFGVSPGITAAEGRRLAEQAGLTAVSANRYQGKGVSLKLLIDDKGTVFGVTMEELE